ncbi:MAG: RND transporter [Methylophilaceae bacterium]|nr:MAG: RND transporter [Methylophilaceae bacterium]
MPKQPGYAEKVARERAQVAAWSAQDNAQASTSLNQLIQSSALNALLEEASSANPSLQQALLTLQIRRAQATQTRAKRLPSAEAGFSASKAKDADTSYKSELSVGWELDLWQKLTNNTHAANLDVEQQEMLFQSARDSLGADVMKHWLGLISQQQAIEIEQKRLNTLQKNAQFIVRRYKNGLGSLEDLDSARSNVSSSQASIEAEKEGLAQQQRALNTLLGRAKHRAFEIDASYPTVVMPLADLPEQTLQRRPDLRAAYLAIKAETLRTQVAYKELLPSISLGAALSDIAASPTAALFKNPIWSLLAQLTAPLYKGGALKAEAEIAELQTAYQYQAYRETLLAAISEVEDALGQERSLTKQQQHIAAALTRARNTLTQYQNSYRTGLVDILDLLNVQQQTYNLEAQLNNIIFTRLHNRVNLGLALGLPIGTELDG